MTVAGRTVARRPEPPVPAGNPRRRLLADRDARLYLAGQITSMVGDSSLWLAMGIWVKVLTGSSSQAALVWLAFIAGGLTGPLSAVLADRLPLRPVLIATNLASAAGVLVLLGVHAGDVWPIYPVMFGYGVSNALLNAGSSALITPMFGTDLLAGANAMLATAKQGMNLVAPVVGAGVFAAVGAAPVVIGDAATFLVAAAALSLIRTAPPRSARTAPPGGARTSPSLSAGPAGTAGTAGPAGTAGTAGPAGAAGGAARWAGPWAVLSAGMRHIMRTPALRRVVLAVSVAIVGLGLLEPVEYSINGQGLHRAPAFIGVLFACQGVGAVLGGTFAARAVRVLGEVRTAALGFAAASAGTALMAVPALPVVVTAFALYGAALPWFVVAQQTQLQRLTPQEVQGRAAGAAGLLTKTPQASGIAVGSALIGLLGYLALLGLIALITASAACWLLLAREAVTDPPVPPPRA